MGFLASSFGFSQSIAGIASPDTNVDVRIFQINMIMIEVAIIVDVLFHPFPFQVTITNNNSPTITATVQGTASAANTNNDNDQNTATSTNTNTNTNGRNFNQGLQFGRALSETLQVKKKVKKKKVRKVLPQKNKSGSILLDTLISSLNLLKTSVPVLQAVVQ